MEIRFVGAHSGETTDTKLTCVVVDGVLALDAGALTSGLCLQAQQTLKAILLTHQHFDHIRDIATLGLQTSQLLMSGLAARSKLVYATATTRRVILNHIFNGEVFPNFSRLPSEENPALAFRDVRPGETFQVDSYRVLPIPVEHAVPAVGYLVTAADEKSLFFTGDTGPGFAARLAEVKPDLIITEVTGLNRQTLTLNQQGHLTSQTLNNELLEFRMRHRYLPPVVVLHAPAHLDTEIRHEVAQLADQLGASITVAHEGMTLKI